MGNAPDFLFDLHQGRDQRWRWHGCQKGRDDFLIVSRRNWHDREQAAQGLRRFLQAIGLMQRR